MEFQITTNSYLKSLTFINDNDKVFILLKDWVKFLQQHRKDNEQIIRKSNIIKVIRNYSDGLSEVSGQPAISITSLIRYISNHYDRFEICQKIFQEIIQCILRNPLSSETDSTVY